MMSSSASLGVLEPSHGEPLSISASEDQQSHATTSSNIQTHGSPNRSSRIPARKNISTKSNQSCRFFTSKNGCRAGDQCRFQHVRPAETSSTTEVSISSEATTHPESHPSGSTSTPPDNVRPIIAVSRPVVKPVSQKEVENPREYQITQVVRRYSPFRADLDDKSTLKFRLTPTDPDFPFELETGLHCVLNVPVAYPQNGRPSLELQNPDMPKGFQINVEKGFDSLVEQHPGKSLLALLNELDKNLERFLSSAKATTVKFVAPVRAKQTVKKEQAVAVPETALYTSFQSVKSRYSSDQLKEAKTRRDVEIRQLEARLGRSENFSKAGDGVAFNVPLQLPSSDKIPPSLRSLRESALIVPEVYPLEPCTVILRGVDGDEAENVEIAFEKRVVSHPQLSLMAHINYLTQNLGKLAVDTRPKSEVVDATEEETDDSAKDSLPDVKAKDDGVRDPNRPHVKYIARPPEWNVHHDQGSADETESSDYDSEDDDGSEDGDSDLESTAGGAVVSDAIGPSIEKGISISFLGLDINGIELLEMVSLSITIKCERCKQVVDIKDVKGSKSDGTAANIHRVETCTKCTMPFTITFRPELMHANNNRAGHIDIENSTVTNLLPSVFQPTCASCSTAFPNPPGVTTIPGDTSLSVCRSCHSKMTLHIPEVKFLRISTMASTTALPLRKCKSKDPLHGAFTANTPLPNTGNCQHYGHSHRWFRFSCCNTVHPCDKCHDTSPAQKIDPHPNEHADRMICGWCSREQRYHPDTCRFCGRSVVKGGTKGVSGFWEGGKGTRDRNLMRRKEGRKFKRGPGEKRADEEKRRKRKEGKGRGGMWWPG